MKGQGEGGEERGGRGGGGGRGEGGLQIPGVELREGKRYCKPSTACCQPPPHLETVALSLSLECGSVM